MELSIEIIEELATKGLILKYGETQGKVFAFMFFGKFGLLGLVDVGDVVKKATDKKNSNIAKELTEDMAADLVLDTFVEIMDVVLKKAGVTILEKFENPLLILSILFKPVKLGNGELPVEIRKQMDNQQQINIPEAPTEQPQEAPKTAPEKKPENPYDNEHPHMDHEVHSDTKAEKVSQSEKAEKPEKSEGSEKPEKPEKPGDDGPSLLLG